MAIPTIITILFTAAFFGLSFNPLLMYSIPKFYLQADKYQENELPDTNPDNQQEYDFIIIGAGSAGATIASRLSETENVSVLLIEAGGHENLYLDIPLAAIPLQIDTEWNWHYLTEPSDDYCRGYTDKQCRIAMGKVMGGCSSINAMIVSRGNKYDYDEWASIMGDQNWSHEGMLKSFKKLERFNVTGFKSDLRYHGAEGPIPIINPPYQTPLADAFVKAGEQLGYSKVDYNGHRPTGFAYVQTNQINGERMSSNRAYLHPIKGKRKNLSVSMFSNVNKILIDPKTKTAYGVEFIKNNEKIMVVAKKEVILSAGGVASPKLLMLSGIGPRKHLESLNISVVQDLPVGENLMDHIGFGTLIFLVNETITYVTRDLLHNQTNTEIHDYITNRTGRLTIPSGAEALAFVNVDDPKRENDKPNVELIFLTMSLFSEAMSRYSFGISDKTFENYFQEHLHQHSYSIIPILTNPKSRGKVLLRSNNPADKPKLVPNYLSHPEDVRVSVKAIRLALNVSKSKAMQKYGSKLFFKIIPGCEEHEFDSDAFWECGLRTFTISIWHYSGTCKAGKDNDPTAVVNSKLQVKDIKNLRVADASIMPVIPTGHTNIPTIAIGEKFSEILKSEYGFI